MKCRLALRVFVYFLNRTPEMKDLLTGWNKTFQFNLEGEPPFYIVLRDGRATLAQGAITDADAVVSAPSALFFQILVKKVSADEAFMNKKYQIHGSPTDVTRLRFLGEKVEAYHSRAFDFLFKLEPVTTRLGL